MQLLHIDTTQEITPDLLRSIAIQLESTGLPLGCTPYPWSILPTSPSRILSEIRQFEDIETDADSIRDHLDDTILGLERLRTLVNSTLSDLSSKFPMENIDGYFYDIQEQHTLVLPHVIQARKYTVDICTAIDPQYSQYLPT